MVTEAQIQDAIKRIRKQGPCAMCGGPYARHRVIDGYAGMLEAGESLVAIADWYGTSPAIVEAEIAALERLLSKVEGEP